MSHRRFSLRPRTFLCSIFAGFSLAGLLAAAILDPFPYSNYLTVSCNFSDLANTQPFIKQALYLHACYCVKAVGTQR